MFDQQFDALRVIDLKHYPLNYFCYINISIHPFLTKMSFQIDDLRLASDWLTFKNWKFYWPRAPPYWHQFENLLELNLY